MLSGIRKCNGIDIQEVGLEAAIPFKECVIAHWSSESCADNLAGLSKCSTEAMDLNF